MPWNCTTSYSNVPGYSPLLSLLLLHYLRQGILVHISADGECLYLDDGTGVIELSLRPEFRGRPWNIGMYVMVVGRYMVRADEPPMIQVHKMVDLSASPDREAMWYLEVLEAYKMFYRPLMEGPV
ncbi:recQ-mediated genome instability protein 2 isoform X2 [Prunus avium]|uniref:RecQ-mediated genome instability protein 2 isoform X2 n=1 Tax=Prunus avium TaxID=42229 RepID=A0A6P5SEA2_PRUAV|nr:recQ-mediated genome instability protein 2 isoform X2 [Prunus avium]